MSSGAAPEPDLPPLPWEPLPESLTSAFKGLSEWQERMIAANAVWIQKANYILRNAR